MSKHVCFLAFWSRRAISLLEKNPGDANGRVPGVARAAARQRPKRRFRAPAPWLAGGSVADLKHFGGSADANLYRHRAVRAAVPIRESPEKIF
ncbi:hypothetical protein [Burkholderia sp. Ac-20353]|uniref:hypothetical protein n=1 Tax=Burkholderia sp. Ac-20353 TaxID=2703894 RepID=UPI00197C06C0|nr:hypothetical protein [Burkholderia sp. Ac-20353]MBN3791648.1 hypothetical protein [Burkholderia sp. Ac-20353]